VRKNVGKRFLSDNAGELAPYESWRRKINHYTTWAMDINSSRLFHVSLWLLRASCPSFSDFLNSTRNTLDISFKTYQKNFTHYFNVLNFPYWVNLLTWLSKAFYAPCFCHLIGVIRNIN
jgi:hypothetical protein